jgi:hypothetical protein
MHGPSIVTYSSLHPHTDSIVGCFGWPVSIIVSIIMVGLYVYVSMP